MELSERYRGALLGLAVGDALGTALEFQSPGTFSSIMRDVFDYVDLMMPLPSYAPSRPAKAILCKWCPVHF